ncbi:MAG: UbiX family flavin prenyltransferase [Bacteroidales bacterium]|nr:UbiX family flavin prenyltransferase [Bacteroidales bacterium]
MKKILIGITGASGSIYAKILIEKVLKYSEYYLSVIYTETAKEIWQFELNENVITETERIKIYENSNLFAPPSSGSSNYDYMIIIPCSMGMLARIANGISNDLISRAADVILKEKKKLIIVPREMPYNLIHIENMRKLILCGSIIIPASPSFYQKPSNINELVVSVVNKVLNQIEIKTDEYPSWEDMVV